MSHEPIGGSLGVGALRPRRLLPLVLFGNLVVPHAAPLLAGALQDAVQGRHREVVVVLLRPVNRMKKSRETLAACQQNEEIT